jgi:peptide/nickel transport system permease protein
VTRYFIQKTAQYLLVILVALSVNFLLPRLMPGNPLVLLAGEDVAFLSPQEKADLLDQYGLNRPLGEQYVMYLQRTVRGDFGYSYQQKRPIVDILKERIPWTLLLTGSALVISTVVGILAGAAAAWQRGARQDIGLVAGFMFLNSMPSFWVGMILVAVFGAQLKWLPVYGARTVWQSLDGWAYCLDVFQHLALPLTSLVLISVASSFLTMRYSMLSVLGQDYIVTARSKGLPELVIKYKHAVRNALLPVVTVFMMQLGYVFGGATVIETVFACPGLGRLMFEAVVNRDYPVLQATFLIMTTAVVVGNMLADMVYPFIDPRIRR